MTKTLHPSSGEDQASEQLAVLQKLCAEVAAANLALARNELAAFQEHTSQMEGLCGSLRQQRMVTSGHEAGGHRISIGLDDRIRTLHCRLSEACYRLSALVRHRRRTVSLLARHYQTMVHTSDAGGVRSPNLHTWSSEV